METGDSEGERRPERERESSVAQILCKMVWCGFVGWPDAAGYAVRVA